MQDRLLHAISAALKLARKEAGLSQEQLGDRCGLDRTYISGIERRVRNPSIKTLQKIYLSLGITDQEFLQLVANALDEEPTQN